jgi:hypothetical protein
MSDHELRIALQSLRDRAPRGSALARLTEGEADV